MPLIVTQFARMAGDADGHLAQIPMQPYIASESVSVGSAMAGNFTASTKFVCVSATEACHYKVGASADTSDEYIAAGGRHCFGVIPGQTMDTAAPA